MTPIINRVRWSASNLAWGISFDEATGTFSGTPEEAGEYVVPVSVETNYGKATQDIRIVVNTPLVLEIEEGDTYPIYVKGTYATSWSKNAAADADGFRAIDMPFASRLVTLYKGFGARTDDNRWYICADDTSGKNWGYASFSSGNTPKEFPVENIVDMSTGGYYPGNLYFAYLTSDCTKVLSRKLSSSTAHYTSTRMKIVKISQSYSGGFCSLASDGKMYIARGSFDGDTPSLEIPVNALDIKQIMINDVGNDNIKTEPYFLTSSGELYQGTEHVSFSGRIKSIYGSTSSIEDVFVVTEDNLLYAKGYNGSYSLGLSQNSKVYDDFTFVGEFNVKKIEKRSNSCYLLTEDGKLYHSGTYSSVVCGKHKNFTQVFPDKVFHDISVPVGIKSALTEETLIAIIKTDLI